MESKQLLDLLAAYKRSDKAFQATSYWASYESSILKAIAEIELEELRSSKYPVLATFGFNDAVYTYHPRVPFHINWALKFIHKFIIGSRGILPYGLGLSGLRQIAYDNCELVGEVSAAVPISSIGMSTFGKPRDLFQFSGKSYSMAFLDYYIRYCFVQRNMKFRGDEVVVELGSGSGYQVELLKKAHPGLTILCFDLPAQLFLCEQYLSKALGEDEVVGTRETIDWTDLSKLKKGAVHFFGSWQFPFVRELDIDLFWNAASFGEMEPDVVKNYLGHVVERARWVYLLQARFGKETQGETRVEKKIRFEDYVGFLEGYSVESERDARKALGHMPEYFEAMWKRN